MAEYCGSVANSVTTKDKNGNIMYVRLYVSKEAKNGTSFNATFNAYRTLDPAKDGKKITPSGHYEPFIGTLALYERDSVVHSV